jgi:hypothetical protein
LGTDKNGPDRISRDDLRPLLHFGVDEGVHPNLAAFFIIVAAAAARAGTLLAFGLGGQGHGVTVLGFKSAEASE